MKFLNLTTYLLVIVVLFNSCSKKEDSGHIEADISKLTTDFDKVVVEKGRYDYDTGKQIYTNDTINTNNGQFDYRYKVNEPQHTAFYLLKKGKRVGKLSFKDEYSKTGTFWGNPLFGNEHIKFFVDSVYKTIEYDGVKNFKIEFDGSEEADIFIKLNHYKMLTAENIKKYSSSYALLNDLFDKRDSYTVEEIKKLSSLFSEDLKNSKTYSLIQTYVKNKLAIEVNGFKSNFNWVNINGKNYNFEQALNGKEKMLLVFWASWCGPCRQEIPELKKFYGQYNDKVSIVNLSIDNDYEWWKKAVDKEKMPWLNLSGLPKNKNGVGTQYNISSVPTMILIDKHGKILKQIVNNDLPAIENLLKEKPLL
ncbi:TlpA disulfide reductase family protein [Flavobacterium sp. 1]|uniref:TlpA family protein disulfide reductase n=1 Tax=Flavobacterium sp. 1 TaxID=2035200 RepID=UPI0012FE774F|nr:TlpA disulfide reductase family protein [Flavobacterium sp. 1]